MDQHELDASPQALARIGGVLYLMIIGLGLFGEAFVRERIVISGDAAATAANVRDMESLWRLGIAAELVLLICAITVAAILYILLRPVSRDLAVLAVFFNLVSLATEAAAATHLVSALFPLEDRGYLGAFELEQLHALATFSIRSHAHGFGVTLIFFGCFSIVLGYLISRSGYLPKVIGILLQIAGVSYLINSFAHILAPDLGSRLFPAILIPAFIGELSLALWLLVKGVRQEEWNARASTPAVPMDAAAV